MLECLIILSSTTRQENAQNNIIVNNKARKRPTNEGIGIGITVEEKTNQYGNVYEGVFYNKNAQHFIIDNLCAIVDSTK